MSVSLRVPLYPNAMALPTWHHFFYRFFLFLFLPHAPGSSISSCYFKSHSVCSALFSLQLDLDNWAPWLRWIFLVITCFVWSEACDIFPNRLCSGFRYDGLRFHPAGTPFCLRLSSSLIVAWPCALQTWTRRIFGRLAFFFFCSLDLLFSLSRIFPPKGLASIWHIRQLLLYLPHLSFYSIASASASTVLLESVAISFPRLSLYRFKIQFGPS